MAMHTAVLSLSVPRGQLDRCACSSILQGLSSVFKSGNDGKGLLEPLK